MAQVGALKQVYGKRYRHKTVFLWTSAAKTWHRSVCVIRIDPITGHVAGAS